jgi:mono/diheme cytochrome c family protein
MKGPFSFFSKRGNTPIESRNYSNVYLILSGLLFIGTMWSVLDEVTTRRPWKDTEEQYYNLTVQKWQDKLKDAVAAFDSTAYKQVQDSLNAANAAMETPEYKALDAQISKMENDLIDANRNYTFTKSKSDEAYYFWKKSVHEEHEDLGWKKKVDDYAAQLTAYGAIVDQMTAQHDTLAAQRKVYLDLVKYLKKRVATIYTDIDLAKSKIDKARSAPIVIHQVMMNGMDKSNFGIPKPRIDRCQTCHLGYKEDVMADAPEPYTEHPLPELLKIHKPETFGCTPCHHGQGAALTEGGAHGNTDKYWEWPLLKGKEVYASCNQCHTNQSYLAYGDRFNKAKEILEESGCFGCHEIKGFNDLAKIGPEITQVGAKTAPDWIFRWVRNPKDYNPHTRMPNFRLSDDEAEAITAYLENLEKENPYPIQKGISAGGNAEHGKQLVNTVGCKGCHVVGEDTRMREARGFSFDIAPELSRAGSKLNPDWIFQWIKNPRNYRPHTMMPNLRLTDQEAKDIVAYISTLKDDRQFEQKTLALDNPDMIKKGDKLIRDYGCAGCHVIKGMEKEQKVSVSLSNIGRKRIDEIDFGDTRVPHTWEDWIFNKIKDARMYATDRIVSKMPVFALADSEIISLRTLLRGMTKDGPEEEYQQPFDKRLRALEAGRRTTHYYHCINCHQVEEIGGAVKATLDDEALAPPFLGPEGSKVQEEWLHGFLQGPTPIRPWLSLRMPTFSLTDDEIGTITTYFLAMHKSDLEIHDYKAFQPDPTIAQAGTKLFDEFQCLSCHYTGTIPQGKTFSDLAPNLAMAKDRLKPDWVIDWIANPDSIAPGVRMPSFYPDMQTPDPDILGGNSMEQIRALRDHVFTIGKK